MTALANYMTTGAAIPRSGVLAGRIWNPAVDGPSVVRHEAGMLLDITSAFPTMRDLCEVEDPASAAIGTYGESLGYLTDILANTPPERRDETQPWLLPPIDLQAIKAAGVTFAISMLERVIEERARGNPQAAIEIRASIQELIGATVASRETGTELCQPPDYECDCIQSSKY